MQQPSGRGGRGTSTGAGEALHVTPLGPAKGEDALLGQQIQRHRVNALLVHHQKGFVCALAHLPQPQGPSPVMPAATAPHPSLVCSGMRKASVNLLDAGGPSLWNLPVCTGMSPPAFCCQREGGSRGEKRSTKNADEWKKLGKHSGESRNKGGRAEEGLEEAAKRDRREGRKQREHDRESSSTATSSFQLLHHFSCFATSAASPFQPLHHFRWTLPSLPSEQMPHHSTLARPFKL